MRLMRVAEGAGGRASSFSSPTAEVLGRKKENAGLPRGRHGTVSAWQAQKDRRGVEEPLGPGRCSIAGVSSAPASSRAFNDSSTLGQS